MLNYASVLGYERSWPTLGHERPLYVAGPENFLRPACMYAFVSGVHSYCNHHASAGPATAFTPKPYLQARQALDEYRYGTASLMQIASH